jgi:peptidoglycan/xylan/chitin deacetylase (PgdA/CDA1 family)
MPAGWRRPAAFLLLGLLVVTGCAAASPSPSPSASASVVPSVAPSLEPSEAPSPSDTPGPTPVASGCQTGPRADDGEPVVIGRVADAGEAMALTFDMGGRLDPALDIIQFLIENQVCTTLFPTGAMSLTPTGQQVLALVAAHPELFEIGNHTMHHCNLRDGGAGSPTRAPCVMDGPPPAAFIEAELTDAATILEAGTGQDPRPYWRPPEAVSNEFVRGVAAELGYPKTIMWDIDTIDWREIRNGGPSAEQIATQVVTSATGGSIVLMHLGGYETFAALQIMVPALRERGLLLTSVSDLLNPATP